MVIAESLSVLGLGFLLGVTHAFDTDHMVAVTTLVSKHRNIKKASLFGAFWGLGHTSTLFLVGLFILIFKISIPEKIALSLEFLVGMMIVFQKNIFIHILTVKIHIYTFTHIKILNKMKNMILQRII